MKSVVRSAKPYYVYLILKGIKTVEVGKDCPTSPDWDRTVELYCSKDKKSFNRIPQEDREWMRKYLGKVACWFVCDSIDIIAVYNEQLYAVEHFQRNILQQSCLTVEEVKAYLGAKNRGTAWHISELKIYDVPKELSSFFGTCNTTCYSCKNPKYFEGACDEQGRCQLKTPPQSWQYCEVS